MVYYVIKIVSRLAFPIVMKKFAQKMEDQIRRQQGFNENTEHEIGKTVVDKKPNSKNSNKDVGEYVDFEEID